MLKKGIDVAGIDVVGQWRANKVDYCTLNQRFGRAARDPNRQGIAVLFIEQTLAIEEGEDTNKRTKKRKNHQQAPKRRKRQRISHEASTSSTQETLPVVDHEAALQKDPISMELQEEGLSQEQTTQAEMDDDDNKEETNVSDPVTTREGNGHDVPESVDLESRWEEYFDWDCQKNFTGANRPLGMEPALRDLVKGVSPTMRC